MLLLAFFLLCSVFSDARALSQEASSDITSDKPTLPPVAVALREAVSRYAATNRGHSIVVYTTGGQGFVRRLNFNIPLIDESFFIKDDQAGPASQGKTIHQLWKEAFDYGEATERTALDYADEDNRNTSLLVQIDDGDVVDLTLSLRLRKSFFIDIAEAESLWDAHIVELRGESRGVEKDLEQAPSLVGIGRNTALAKRLRAGAGALVAVQLQHPIKSEHPFDIEAPTVKVPYQYNTIYLKFRVQGLGHAIRAYHKHAAGGGDRSTSTYLLKLSVPFHERYEDVSVDGRSTHVRRCIDDNDIVLAAAAPQLGGELRYGYLARLPFRFSANIQESLSDGLGISPSSNLANTDRLCFDIPVGSLPDLPLFYSLTMALMALGSLLVFLSLSLPV